MVEVRESCEVRWTNEEVRLGGAVFSLSFSDDEITEVMVDCVLVMTEERAEVTFSSARVVALDSRLESA